MAVADAVESPGTPAQAWVTVEADVELTFDEESIPR